MGFERILESRGERGACDREHWKKRKFRQPFLHLGGAGLVSGMLASMGEFGP